MECSKLPSRTVQNTIERVKNMAVKMVDVSDKPMVERIAIAKGTINLFQETIVAIKDGGIEKGDVLAAAQIAGVHAVKSTPTLIPMCHQIPITHTDIQFRVKKETIDCICEVHAKYKTGVEMEALVGVTVSLLTIWDMVKYLEKDEEGQYRSTNISNINVDVKLKEVAE